MKNKILNALSFTNEALAFIAGISLSLTVSLLCYKIVTEKFNKKEKDIKIVLLKKDSEEDSKDFSDESDNIVN